MESVFNVKGLRIKMYVGRVDSFSLSNKKKVKLQVELNLKSRLDLNHDVRVSSEKVKDQAMCFRPLLFPVKLNQNKI